MTRFKLPPNVLSLVRRVARETGDRELQEAVAEMEERRAQKAKAAEREQNPTPPQSPPTIVDGD